MHFRLVPDNRYYLLYDLQIHKSAPIDSEKNQTSNFGNVQNLTFAFFFAVANTLSQFDGLSNFDRLSHLDGLSDRLEPETGITIFRKG